MRLRRGAGSCYTVVDSGLAQKQHLSLKRRLW